MKDIVIRHPFVFAPNFRKALAHQLGQPTVTNAEIANWIGSTIAVVETEVENAWYDSRTILCADCGCELVRHPDEPVTDPKRCKDCYARHRESASKSEHQTTDLHINDRVIWSGGWGSQQPQLATVVGITRTRQEHAKVGVEVSSIPWSEVPKFACVDLDNGHWAYGYQLQPAPKEQTS